MMPIERDTGYQTDVVCECRYDEARDEMDRSDCPVHSDVDGTPYPGGVCCELFRETGTAHQPDCGNAPWHCPYCGETGGEPYTVYSREYQGDSPHGGIVEWSDECCTLCKGRPGRPSPSPEERRCRALAWAMDRVLGYESCQF